MDNMKKIIALCLVLSSCADYEWRPAKGAKSYSSTSDAFRAGSRDQLDSCAYLGNVYGAQTIPELASGAASHGGTHYWLANDFGSEETRTSGSGLGGGSFHSTSEVVQKHLYVGEVFRCAESVK